jgi:hypothetical protein
MLFWMSVAAAQDLPDPGRRVDKKAPPKEAGKTRDEQICERARVNRQLACGAPYSAKSRSTACTEAMVLQSQSC